MWAVPDYVPTVVEPIADISTYQALTSMQMTTLTRQLAVTLGISIISFLELGLFRTQNKLLAVLEPA